MSEITREDALAHFGVKGMKWGQRKNTPDSSGVTKVQARKQIKIQNRDTDRRLQDFERASDRSDQIRKARADKIKTTRKYQDVKADLKEQRKTGALGKNAAKVLLNKNANMSYENSYKASARTTGEEVVAAIFSAYTTPRTSY